MHSTKNLVIYPYPSLMRTARVFICFIALAGFSIPLKTDQPCIGNNLTLNSTNHTLWLTIFVHGIISVKPHLSVGNIIKLMRDKIADSSYARTVELIRKDPFFYQHHPMQELGLKKIDIDTVLPGAASSAFATAFHKISNYTKESKDHHLYYTFGWSGLLSPQMRYLEAEIFYKAIEELIATLHNDTISIKLRIVGYSHGGNVALKLADIHESKHRNEKIKIDQLILVGVPILPESPMLIAHDIFEKIYHFYSLGDRIQNLDCFALNRFFSERTVGKKCKNLKEKKLVQVRLVIKRPRKSLHREDAHPKRLRYCHLRNADPGHSEFWSFGWTHSSYRANFPLHPLPVGVFTPFIINTLQEHDIHDHDLTVELHPYHEKMFIKRSRQTLELPFIKHVQLTALKKETELFRPLNYHPHEYNKRIRNAIVQGKKEKKEDNNYLKETRKERRARKKRSRKR